jgi:ketosteroid isomerase-like protein
VPIDYPGAAALLDRFVRARESFDGDAWVDLFTEDAEYRPDPFEPPLVGHNALRAWLLEAAEVESQLELTIERHWAVGDTVLAATHGSYVRRTDRARVRFAAFLLAEVRDRRIARLRMWSHRREWPSPG